MLSHCSLLRNRWPKPTGVLEHCRDCSPFLGAFSSDRVPKVTKDELNLWKKKFSSCSNSCNSYQRIPLNFVSEFRENFEVTTYYFVGHDNVVGIVTRYGLEGLGIQFRCRRDFLHLSRPTVGSDQPPVKGGTGPFQRLKRPRRGVDHPPHLKPRLNKDYSFTSTPPLVLLGLF